ncbi:MAG: lysylphosphatidylglycerol synthase transmembrane domain-containing protein [Anaerolineae bacterium]|nr:flippase-like domain-containing protein [Anaerolineae bacterium]MDW8102216.1 lysylphosphatidylglycerol synthase transmembrane domain-containing protein [Anaerolineae bacterium]
MITLFFIALAVKKIDWGKTWQSLQGADYRFVALAFISTSLSYFLRTTRWKWILEPAGNFSFPVLFPSLMVGFAINNLLPGRLGEFARAYLVSRKTKVSVSLSFATVVVERVLDGLTIVGAMGAVGLFYPLPDWGKKVALLSAFLFLSTLMVLLSLLFLRAQTMKILGFLANPLPQQWERKLLGMISSFTEGLEILRSGPVFLRSLTFSVVIWGVETVTYYLGMRALHIPLAGWNGVWQALFFMSAVNLGIMIPAAPGGLGPYQASAILALAVFGVPKEVALSASLLTHAVQYFYVVALGLYFMGKEGLSLTEIMEERAR